ncbi:MAG: DUF4981 domain-containing protein [Lentisphaerae bacterium]|nr:DUF4981 domain-containing protein [Lentisphaerota bacterium]
MARYAGAVQLAVKVLRIAAATYLEDQDYWQLSGIERDVTLFAKPSVHLRDYTVRTRFTDKNYGNATLEVTAYMSRLDPADEWEVQLELFDSEGVAVFEQPLREKAGGVANAYATTNPENFCAIFSKVVETPRHWTAESPVLYTVVLSLVDKDGVVIDVESARIGFRELEIREGVLLLNGRRLVIRGVNQHEYNSHSGRVMSEEWMRSELIAMKRLNINAVRTSHYPHCSRWYELCDELGLYVVDEANIETHQLWASLSRAPEWAGAYLQRALRLVLRDRNHPAVITWSLGNESGCGANHAAMAAWIRHFDGTRPVQYESGRPGPDISDIFAPMYPDLNWVQHTLADPHEKRPLIMCEYAYGKGNSGGNFFKFWDLIYTLPRFQGGFMWDWADKAFVRKLADGRDGYFYGELEGEGSHVARMCLNGIVFHDLSLKPAAYEMWKCQAPVRFAEITAAETRAGRFHIFNLYLDSELDHLELLWEVEADGITVESGRCDLPAAAPREGLTYANTLAAAALGGFAVERQADIIEVPFKTGEVVPGAVYTLNLRCVLRQETAWAEKGHCVAWEQFTLPVSVPALMPRGIAGGERVEEPLQWQDDDMSVIFDPAAGALSSLSIAGNEMIVRGFNECFYRVPTDIDEAQGGEHTYAGKWRNAGLNRLERRVDDVRVAAIGKSGLRIICDTTTLHEGRTIACTRTTHTLEAGEIGIEMEFQLAGYLPFVPRVGVEGVFADALTEAAWFGRGPFENYSDRKHAAMLGRYAMPVAKLFTPYIYPIDNGVRQDVRWLELASRDGSGLRFSAMAAPFHFSALNYSWQDLERAGYVHELKPRGEVYLHIDTAQSGLGGDTGWSQNIHPEFQVEPGYYRLAFRIEALKRGK